MKLRNICPYCFATKNVVWSSQNNYQLPCNELLIQDGLAWHTLVSFFFVEQDFDQNFWVNCSWFFAFLSGLLGLIHAHSMKDIYFSVQVRWESCYWLIKLITSCVVLGTWISTGGSGENGLRKVLLSWCDTYTLLTQPPCKYHQVLWFYKISSCAFIIRVEITLIYDMQLKCDMHVVFCLFVALES